MMKQKILLVGGGGFIGHNLAIFLKNKKGFILDGYPRNLTQAKNLDSLFKNKNIKLEYVFLIDVPFDVLIERCTGRLLCTTCDYIGNMD